MSDIAHVTNLYRIVNLLQVAVVFYIWKYVTSCHSDPSSNWDKMEDAGSVILVWRYKYLITSVSIDFSRIFMHDLQSCTISIRDCVHNTTSSMHDYDAESCIIPSLVGHYLWNFPSVYLSVWSVTWYHTIYTLQLTYRWRSLFQHMCADEI